MLKNKFFFPLLFLPGAMVLFTGCASDGNRRLDEKLDLAKEVPRTELIGETFSKSVIEDSHLTSEQKEKLNHLKVITAEELNRLRKVSRQLRMLLVEDFKESDDAETDLILERLFDNSKRQVLVLSEALDSARAIIGKSRKDIWFDLD